MRVSKQNQPFEFFSLIRLHLTDTTRFLGRVCNLSCQRVPDASLVHRGSAGWTGEHSSNRRSVPYECF